MSMTMFSLWNSIFQSGVPGLRASESSGKQSVTNTVKIIDPFKDWAHGLCLTGTTVTSSFISRAFSSTNSFYPKDLDDRGFVGYF